MLRGARGRYPAAVPVTAVPAAAVPLWKRIAPWFVYAVIGAVAAWDVGTGLILLLSDAPHLVHGDGFLWAELAPLLADPQHADAVESLLRRVGAFSLFAGGATAVWAVYGARRDRRAITVLLVAWTVLGLGFGWVDGRFFADTEYAQIKQLFGAAWVLALIAHLAAGPPRSE